MGIWRVAFHAPGCPDSPSALYRHTPSNPPPSPLKIKSMTVRLALRLRSLAADTTYTIKGEVSDAGQCNLEKYTENDAVYAISCNNFTDMSNLSIFFPITPDCWLLYLFGTQHLAEALQEVPCSYKQTSLITLAAWYGPESTSAFAAAAVGKFGDADTRKDYNKIEAGRKLQSHDDPTLESMPNRTVVSGLVSNDSARMITAACLQHSRPFIYFYEGTLDVELAFDGSAFGRLCNGVANCSAILELPVNQSKWSVNATYCSLVQEFAHTDECCAALARALPVKQVYLVRCARLERIDHNQWNTIYSLPEPLGSETPDVVRCRTNFLGRFMIVQLEDVEELNDVSSSQIPIPPAQKIQDMVSAPQFLFVAMAAFDINRYSIDESTLSDIQVKGWKMRQPCPGRN
eukprot:1161450-Pelagomonas_calceolata.AAC.1